MKNPKKNPPQSGHHSSPTTSGTLQPLTDALHLFGRNALYPAALFEYLSEPNIFSNLTPGQMSTLLSECGRHGLRCKHFVDRVIKQAARLEPQMTVDESMTAAQGLLKFIKDWQPFFHSQRKRMHSSLLDLSPEQLLVCLKICREFRHVPDYLHFQRDVCSVLTTGIISSHNPLSLADHLIPSLVDVNRDGRLAASVRKYVQAVQKKFVDSIPDDRLACGTVERTLDIVSATP